MPCLSINLAALDAELVKIKLGKRDLDSQTHAQEERCDEGGGRSSHDDIVHVTDGQRYSVYNLGLETVIERIENWSVSPRGQLDDIFLRDARQNCTELGDADILKQRAAEAKDDDLAQSLPYWYRVRFR